MLRLSAVSILLPSLTTEFSRRSEGLMRRDFLIASTQGVVANGGLR
jgi:hypothetical protein